MKILILGSGGREHALVWAVARSPRVTEVICAPGNGGIAQLARCVPVDLKSLDAMVRLAEAEQPGLTIVGPELPLSLGIVDALQQRGLRVFGPTRAAAMLETSKGFAKQFLHRHNIPTGNYAVCSTTAEVAKAIEVFHPPIVVKADGLAAGKGVVICPSRHAALETAQDMFSGALLGAAESQVVIEEFLQGEEVSFLCLSDGKHVAPLAPAQDHKRVGEGDTGPNTGGMGAYSPAPLLTDDIITKAQREIIVPLLDALHRHEIDYRGILYIGLMLTAAGPKTLEFNCRFGDPEAQPLLMRLKSDLVDVMLACVDRQIDRLTLAWDPRAAICVVLASEGYGWKPDDQVTRGVTITGLEEAARLPGVQIFHAGTALKDGRLVTSGGRVLGVCASGDDLAQARKTAYSAIEKIHFDGMQYRRDIGARV